MRNQGIHLSWMVVSDVESAVKFYTEVIGLQLKVFSKEFGWAELSGPGGSLLGLSQESPHLDMKAGSNTVTTFTVDDIVAAREELLQKKVKLVGEIMEVPGEVKLQTFADADGNVMQIVQKL